MIGRGGGRGEMLFFLKGVIMFKNKNITFMSYNQELVTCLALPTETYWQPAICGS